MVARKLKFSPEWLLVGGFAVALAVASFFPFRVDFTKDKRYTLTPKTEEFLKGTEHEITITLFLNGQLPAPFKRLRNATIDLLNDYRTLSKATINIRYEDPIEISNQAEREQVMADLAQVGIEPTNVNIKTDAGFSQKLVYPMAMIESDGKQMPVKLLQNSANTANYEENINQSIQNLEYLFTSSIRKVQEGSNPRIGFTESNGELNDDELADAIQSLSSYQVGRVDLRVISKEGLDKLKLLIIAKPTQAFSEEEKFKLNYFVMQGGRIIFSIDQVQIELDSLRTRPQIAALNRSLNLDDLLFTYGARINYNLISDANCASIPVSAGSANAAQLQLAPWPFFPVLQPDTTNSIVKNLDGVKMEFGSSVDTINVSGVHKSVILRSSLYNIVSKTPTMISLSMAALPDPTLFSMQAKTAGVLLTGEFPSVFKNRPVPAGITETFGLPEVSKPAKIVVIGDGDIFKNQVSSRDGSIFPLGFDRYTQQNYGNKSLLLNLVDDLTSDKPLTELRNREVKVRLLDRVKIRNEKTFWQLLNVFLPIVLLILPAIFQHYYRRYKYAK